VTWDILHTTGRERCRCHSQCRANRSFLWATFSAKDKGLAAKEKVVLTTTPAEVPPIAQEQTRLIEIGVLKIYCVGKSSPTFYWADFTIR
jgi:hypothetical protein